MSKPIQNPRPIFFGNKGLRNLTPFSTHLKPPSPGIPISRSAEPYYIECRVIRPCFIIKSSLPWTDSTFFSPKSQDLSCSFSDSSTRNLDCLQARHLLCLQPRHLFCQQTRGLQSAKTSPGHCRHRGGRFAAAPVWARRRRCLGRLQNSCLLTQQMSWLQTQQNSSLQPQHMSPKLRIHFEDLDPALGHLVLKTPNMRCWNTPGLQDCRIPGFM